MLPLAYFAELVISSLTIKPSGMPSAVGISSPRPRPRWRDRPFLEQQTRKILAQVLEILLELHIVLMIEKMQLAMHAPQRSNATGRNRQLRRPLQVSSRSGFATTADSRSIADR